jgi:hypothetical protein
VSLSDATARAKHDLGKYVAFQLRWLGPDCTDVDLLEALRADVLQTRRGPNGVETAMSIWSRLRPDLLQADIAEVDGAVSVLTEHARGLEEGTLSRDEMEVCQQAARDIARTLAALARAHRS